MTDDTEKLAALAGEGPTTTVVKPNWDVVTICGEAVDLAAAEFAAESNRSAAIRKSLRATLCLIEHYRGEHKEEIITFLQKKAPKQGTDKKGKARDDVLPIVKYVYAHDKAQQWTWRANALKWALEKKQTSDTVESFFETTSPTAAAKEWRKAHPSAETKITVDVPVNGLKLPDGITWDRDEKEHAVKLCYHQGKPVLRIEVKSQAGAEA